MSKSVLDLEELPDYYKNKQHQASVIFGGDNLYDPGKMKQVTFYYYSIGRKTIS